MDMQLQDLAFPDGFLWGVATSAYQIEGNNAKSQWWKWEQDGSKIADGTKSGRACRHYELFEKDIDLVEILGLNCYKFSIEWSRMEPEPGVISEETIDHYKALLRGLHERELNAFVTLHHFSVPQWFDDAGGWLNHEAPDRFASFARLVADKLGEDIDYYVTINEPVVVANASYLVGAHPPGHSSQEEFTTAALNLLYSHAKAARAIRESPTSSEATKVGIAKAITVYEAVDPNNSGDVEEKERRDGLLNKWLLDSLETGRAAEPLGRNEPVPGLPGSCDFIGVNYYLRARVSADQERMRQYYESMRGRTEQSDLGWEVHPQGIVQAAAMAGKLGLPVYITANGIADHADKKREKYIVTHLAELSRAIKAGLDVRGYMHWTLLDDFEWALGHIPKFGLGYVREQDNKRVLKKSSVVYKEIAVENAIPARYAEQYLEPLEATPEEAEETIHPSNEAAAMSEPENRSGESLEVPEKESAPIMEPQRHPEQEGEPRISQ